KYKTLYSPSPAQVHPRLIPPLYHLPLLHATPARERPNPTRHLFDKPPATRLSQTWAHLFVTQPRTSPATSPATRMARGWARGVAQGWAGGVYHRLTGKSITFW